MQDKKSVAKSVFLAGVERVLPDRLIKKSLTLTDGVLGIDDLTFDLKLFRNIYVVGAGKASALMGLEVENILGNRITGGQIVVKYGHSCTLGRIKVTEAAHPVPDENGFRATVEILEFCSRAGEEDLIICLLSGGGSALLSDAPFGIAPEDIMKMNDLLVRSGADISEINSVRKHLSNVKGGQLARVAQPATLITLILSDVIGDPPDVIASGPTVPDSSTFADALSVIEKYDLTSQLPANIFEHLSAGMNGLTGETPKQNDPAFRRTHNILIGTNRIALQTAAEKASELGIDPYIIDDRVSGDILAVANMVVRQALDYQKDNSVIKPVCLLFGGEPTVKVEGKGSGGRNQHLALLCSVMIRNVSGITILSAGTDGTDGPTGAAGAVVDGSSFTRAAANGNDAEVYLKEFNSFEFFEKEGGLIITGPTMTNVMDIIVVIIE